MIRDDETGNAEITVDGETNPEMLKRLGIALLDGAKVRKRISVAERVSPHRMVRVRKATGKPVEQFNATKSPPWLTKPKNRAAAKRARASRKGNR